MFTVALETRLRLVRATLPALVLFDLHPLRVRIGCPIRRLRIHLPGEQALKLRKLELELELGQQDDAANVTEAEQDASSDYEFSDETTDVIVAAPGKPTLNLKRAKFAMSSRTPNSAAPEAVLNGKGFTTEAERNPYWEMKLRAPQMLGAVLATNRRGMPSSRNAALCVDYEDADGKVWTFGNAAAETLLERLGGVVAAVDSFTAEDWYLGRTETAQALRDIRAGLDTLIDGLRAGLVGEEWSAEELTATRLGTIRAITGLVGGLTPLVKREGLRRAAAMLHYLIDRAPDRRAPEGSEEEMLAVAVILASLFIEDGRVSNRQLRENQRYMSTPPRADFMDRFVSDTYHEVTGDYSLDPIMIRSHGMSGAHLLKHPEQYVNSLKEVTELFGDLGYQLAICYGTFLGAVREKTFIPHDDDLDTALLLNAKTPAEGLAEMDDLAAMLRGRGITINRNANGFLKIKAPKAGRRMDVFPVIDDGTGDTIKMVMQSLRMRDVPRDVVLPFGRIEFYGREFLCPANAERFLEERYGPRWNTPLRQVGGRTVEASVSEDKQ